MACLRSNGLSVGGGDHDAMTQSWSHDADGRWFSRGAQGMLEGASHSQLENEFGTSNEDEVVKQILEKGNLQEFEVWAAHFFRSVSFCLRFVWPPPRPISAEMWCSAAVSLDAVVFVRQLRLAYCGAGGPAARKTGCVCVG